MAIITFKTWLKITVWALAIHIILIILTIIEVFIYSIINPNHEDSFYRDHVEVSGPYISIFFGFILFYFVTRLLSKKFIRNKILIALSLPIIYTIMDFLMVHFSGVYWQEHFIIFIISFIVKTLGSLLGVFKLGEQARKVNIKRSTGYILVVLNLAFLSCSKNDNIRPDEVQTATSFISEVCLRAKLSIVNYPHTKPSGTSGVGVGAFGVNGANDPIGNWRNRSMEDLMVFFEAYIIENNIAENEGYILDFEKTYSHTILENRTSIERSINAVRSVRPGANISLFGTPFSPINGGLNSIFKDEDYLLWITNLNIGFIPVLYINQNEEGKFPSLEEVKRLAELSLSVFPPERSTPILWHKWNNGGNWQTNPEIVETYPNLEPIKIQLVVLDSMGYNRLGFWHGDDDPAIAVMLEILFGS